MHGHGNNTYNNFYFLNAERKKTEKEKTSKLFLFGDKLELEAMSQGLPVLKKNLVAGLE